MRSKLRQSAAARASGRPASIGGRPRQRATCVNLCPLVFQVSPNATPVSICSRPTRHNEECASLLLPHSV